jgi:DNA-binding CsgD family transcriptional regulator
MRDLTPVLDLLVRLLPCDHVRRVDPGLGCVAPAASVTPDRTEVHLPTLGIVLHRTRGRFDDEEVALVARLRPALDAVVREATSAPPPDGLTPREAQVLQRVVRGASNGEIGLDLRISSRTVEKHLEHVYRKLGVSGRYGAIASARSSSTSPWSPGAPASTSRHSPAGGTKGAASSRTRTATSNSPAPRRNATVPSPASSGV